MVYGNKVPPEEPPCDTCCPKVWEGNESALRVFSIVQNQFIMGPGGPVDINQLAVWEAIDRFGFTDTVKVFGKVISLSRWLIGRIGEQMEEARSKSG